MFHLPNKAASLLPLVFVPLVLISCGFADLRPIGVSTIPVAPGAVLPEKDSKVIILFDTDMEKLSVERALQVSSPNGAVEGELKWEGRNLHFIPVVSWRPGIRYALKLSGTVTALDGRDFIISKDIPFFAVSLSPLPYLKSFFPSDGMSVAVFSPVILALEFSLPMDRRSTEDALKFEIPGEKIFEWQDDSSVLLVSSDKPLNPWIAYRWSISDKALSREGAPLAKDFSGRFVTDLEREFISVVRVLPLMPPLPFSEAEPHYIWGSWLPAGLSLEPGPGAGHGIGVEFSKPVDSDSLRRAFSFIPSLAGRVEILSPVSGVFIPSKDMEPETVYSMRISGALKDIEGLKMGEDFVTTFKTDIPFLAVNSISFIQGEETSFPSSGNIFLVQAGAGGIVRCIINFSLPFDQKIYEESVFKISLRSFFPDMLLPASLRSARWVSTDRLLMEWEGLEAGEGGEAHFYKLLIPGSVHNGRGSYLKEDFVLYLEVEHE